jgi:hypothetical protein
MHMRITYLATILALATMPLLGCGESTSTDQPDAFVPAGPFELEGNWLYLGPWDGEHTLKFSGTTATYDDIGGAWSSTWTLKSFDNDRHHFQIVRKEATGAYTPAGQELSGSYVLDAVILTVQLADGLGSYPEIRRPGSCTEDDSTKIENCRIYMKQP